jgi:hypothetical protein
LGNVAALLAKAPAALLLALCSTVCRVPSGMIARTAWFVKSTKNRMPDAASIAKKRVCPREDTFATAPSGAIGSTRFSRPARMRLSRTEVVIAAEALIRSSEITATDDSATSRRRFVASHSRSERALAVDLL